MTIRDSVAQWLGRRTRDQAVVGSIPGRPAIKLPMSTQPSSFGVGKSSTGLVGWGYGGARSLVSDGR